MDDTNEENVLGPLSNRNSARNTPRMFRNPPQPHMCVQVSLKSPNNVSCISYSSKFYRRLTNIYC